MLSRFLGCGLALMLLCASGVCEPLREAFALDGGGPSIEGTIQASQGYLIYFNEKPDLAPARSMAWAERGAFVTSSLKAAAAKGQSRVRSHLDAMGASYKAYWSDNVIMVRSSDAAVLESLKAFPEVRTIRARRTMKLIQPTVGKSPLYSLLGVEWNISHINADKVWDMGYTGTGITVANIDTGVLYTHDALVNQYRGNTGSGFNHNFNWWDPSSICLDPLVPCDNHGHGTHTMGTMVGFDGGENRIGVAPGARWFACKGCESAYCTDAALLECAEFVLAPWNLSKASPDPSLRPHVVNNSWGGDGGDDWYQGVVTNWRAAGIYPVFSNGNDGPGCGTVGSPGDYGNVTGVGAIDSLNYPGSFSSRGPSVFENTTNPFGYPYLKPQVAAPGVNIRSSVATGNSSYESGWNGTSMAAPHIAGLVALMWSSAPCLVRDYPTTEKIIIETATPISFNSGCGDGPGNVPNMATGWGVVNAEGAVNAALKSCGLLSGVLVTKAGTGDGTVKSSPSGIDCGDDCFEYMSPGTTVTLTAKASRTSLFGGWSGVCIGTAKTCTFTADGTTQEITATFRSDPDIYARPPSIDFRTIRTGFRSVRLVTIQNKGKANLAIGTPSISGSSAFYFDPLLPDSCSERVLGPARSCFLRVAFKPSSAGWNTGTLSIPSNDPDTPDLLVPLSGYGG
jgi:hypothetical protein